MDTIANPRRAPITQSLGELGQHLTDQEIRIDLLEKEVAALRDHLHAVHQQLVDAHEQLRGERAQDHERILVIDNALDLFRHDATRRRDLPTEADFGVYQLATEYSRFIETDLLELAGLALNSQRARFSENESLEEREALTARDLLAALLLDGQEPDRKRLAGAFDEQPPPQLEAAMRRTAELRAQMAAHRAHFAFVAEPGVYSEGLRLWAACRPGAVDFVVAPALMVRNRAIADNEGEPAGPWVYTTAVAPRHDPILGRPTRTGS